MKKLLFIIDNATPKDLEEFAKKFNSEKEMVFINSTDFKILKIDGAEVTQVYPEQEYEEEETEEVEEGSSIPEPIKVDRKERRKAIIRPESDGKPKRGWKKKYPDEMKECIREHMNSHKNEELCKLINEEWDVDMTKTKLAAYMTYNKLKRDKKKGNPKEIEESLVKDDEPEELESEDFESEEQESEGWKQSIHYNEEGKYLCNSSSSGLDFTKDIESVTCKNCVRILEKREKPKRDPKDLKVNGEQVPRDIMDFIETNKDMGPIVLRDEIIEMFEKNFKLIEIKSMQNQFKEKTGILPPTSDQ